MPRSTTKPIRRRMIWRKTPEHMCSHCGRITSTPTIDHFIPISKGGTDDHRNLMPLCKKCNNERQSNPIDPKTYYRYAYNWAIKQCYQYKREWLEAHRSADGTIMAYAKKR